ncbi:hypothetical protein GQ43DRAFT_425565 [Delitschia confertaspora ATCC 74209]|uniref:Zn(2)-C6 fungal-type domain-containing protein n=1 Tax=Delitschia confertaspora ATCC 74209 TaxID=1513339 RepID=A0A9P4MNC2_9PLEO|nr:hypothetical protein GQ43DRAFT_425565 [Delitschia confertaspora ATCC 74209]
MPRLGHKKSRNGCRQCKARHVKCDENKPCSSCARHGVKCSLVTWPEGAPDPIPVPTTRTASTSSNTTRIKAEDASKPSPPIPTPAPTSLPIELVLNPSPSVVAQSPSDHSSHASSDPFPYLTKFVDKTETAEPDIWIRDLELMHHWSTKAYSTLSVPKHKEHVWQVTAPQHAITHVFLMHELLAYSALHLAFLHPEHRTGYSMLSSHHQNLAIQSMRKVFQNITAENCHALFATSSLITLTAFATTTVDEAKRQTPIDDLLDRYALVQGMYEILKTNHIYLYQGPFSQLLTDSSPSSSTLHTPPPPPLLLALLSQTLQPTQDAIATLIDSIHYATRHQSDDNAELRCAFLWPVRILPAFLNLLRQRHPVGLIVLAHYCVVLHAAGPVHWAMRGWGERVIRGVEGCLMSGRGERTVWAAWLAWCLDVVLGERGKQNEGGDGGVGGISGWGPMGPMTMR